MTIDRQNTGAGTSHDSAMSADQAGSGKSMLLRSWAGASGSGDRIAWVTVGHDGRGPQRFRLSVVDALRRTDAGARLVHQASVTSLLRQHSELELLTDDSLAAVLVVCPDVLDEAALASPRSSAES